MTRAQIARHRAGVEMRRAGVPVTWRRVTVTGSGPSPEMSPPRYSTLLAVAAAAGATTLALISSDLVGRFVAGDALSVGGVEVTVAPPGALATPNPSTTGPANAFRVILPLAAPLPAAIPPNTPVVPRWAADVTVPALIAAAPKRIEHEGALLQVRSFVVTLAAALLPAEPAAQDRVVLPVGGERIVDFVDVEAMDGLPIRFRLQVR